jgi:hypothetical protein
MPGFRAETSLYNHDGQYEHLDTQMDRTDMRTVVPAFKEGVLDLNPYVSDIPAGMNEEIPGIIHGPCKTMNICRCKDNKYSMHCNGYKNPITGKCVGVSEIKCDSEYECVKATICSQ